MVLVHLDARRTGVDVPAKYAVDAELRLNLSYRFASRDLTIGDADVTCTLSFGGFPFRCVLPYSAIYAVTSHVTGEALVWPEDLPAELVAGLEPGLDPASEPTAEPKAQPVAEVRAEPAAGGPSTLPGEAEEKSPAPAVVRPHGHLRLIK